MLRSPAVACASALSMWYTTLSCAQATVVAQARPRISTPRSALARKVFKRSNTSVSSY